MSDTGFGLTHIQMRNEFLRLIKGRIPACPMGGEGGRSPREHAVISRGSGLERLCERWASPVRAVRARTTVRWILSARKWSRRLNFSEERAGKPWVFFTEQRPWKDREMAQKTPADVHGLGENQYEHPYPCTKLMNACASSNDLSLAVYIYLPICGQFIGGISSCITMAEP